MKRTLRLAVATSVLFAVAATPGYAAPGSTLAPSPGPSPGSGAAAACPDSDNSDLCQQVRAIAAVRTKLQASLVTAQGAQAQLQSSLQENAREQDELRGRIDASRQRLAKLADEIRSQDSQIAALQRRIEQQRAQIRVLARAVYFQPTSLLLLISSAQSLRDVLAATADLAVAGRHADNMRRHLAADQTALETARRQTQAAHDEEGTRQQQLESDVQKLDELRRAQEEKSGQLAAKMAQVRTEIAALDKQSKDLAQRIAERLQAEQEGIIGTAMQQAWQQALLWISANPGRPGISAGHSTRYRFIWPEPQAQLTQGFGPTDVTLEPPYGGYPHFHTGLDIAAPQGTQVLACDDGAVAAVGDGDTGYGRYVILAHRDGLLTLYGHLAQPLVKLGDTVIQGQPIGLEGSTGYSTGPHVHFELRIDTKPQDPAPLLPPGPSAARD